MMKKKSIKTLVFIAAFLVATNLSFAQSATPSDNIKISLDFKDADITTVLRVMSLKTGMNIIAGPEVSGVVTIRLEEVEWQQALDVILRTYDYVYEKEGNIVRVTTREKMSAEPLETRTYVINYTPASEIQASIQDMLTERGRIKVSTRTNTLVVSDLPANLHQIEEVISRIDQRTKQAYIDAKIIRTDVSTAENLGISWNPEGSISGSSRPVTFPFPVTDSSQDTTPGFLRQFFPILDGSPSEDIRGFPGTTLTIPDSEFSLGTLDFTNFNAVFNALRTKENTKIVSNPRVVVLNNQTANIQVGQEVPLPTFERNESTGSLEISGFEYRDVGVILNVTPSINDADEILVNLQPQITREGPILNFGTFQVPRFVVTDATTQVLIQSGETIAIGGLLEDNGITTESRVPYFSNIPLVGKLFRSKRQSPGSNSEQETIFFVTVTAVDSSGKKVKKATPVVQEDVEETNDPVTTVKKVVKKQNAA